jgi:hypothetical protein
VVRVEDIVHSPSGRALSVLLHLMNLLKILLLKTAVAMTERRAIPKIGSFIDIVFELRQPGYLHVVFSR